MIGKVARFGAGFLGAMEYCYFAVLPNRSLDRTQVRGELLYCQHVAPGLIADNRVVNLTTGERLHIEALARQFGEVARRNSRVEKPVWHQVFSFPVGESPGRSMMAQIAQAFTTEFGLTNNPLIAFRHHDKDHDHFHIVASRVDLNGVNSARSHYNFQRVGQFCRRMELEFGLTPTEPMLTQQPAPNVLANPLPVSLEHTAPVIGNEQNPPSYLTQHHSVPDRKSLREAIDRTVGRSENLIDFCRKLADTSPFYVQLVPYKDESGRVRDGISYGVKDTPGQKTIPGYALGQDYVYSKIIHRIQTRDRTNSLTSGQLSQGSPQKDSYKTSTAKPADSLNELLPGLPFAGTAARHESDIERDIARINRSFAQANSNAHKDVPSAQPTKGVTPKQPPKKPKRRRGL